MEFPSDREALLYAIHELRNALVPLNMRRTLSESEKNAVGRGLAVASELINHILANPLPNTGRDPTP